MRDIRIDFSYMINIFTVLQVFIGHSENVSKILFTPDGQSLLSVGEAVYMWDFLAAREPDPTE